MNFNPHGPRKSPILGGPGDCFPFLHSLHAFCSYLSHAALRQFPLFQTVMPARPFDSAQLSFGHTSLQVWMNPGVHVCLFTWKQSGIGCRLSKFVAKNAKLSKTRAPYLLPLSHMHPKRLLVIPWHTGQIKMVTQDPCERELSSR